MGEMVDHVARAMRLTAKDDASYEALARAAMSAMREPTSKMVIAGYKANSYPIAGLRHTFAPTPVWQAMIDAAALTKAEVE